MTNEHEITATWEQLLEDAQTNHRQALFAAHKTISDVLGRELTHPQLVVQLATSIQHEFIGSCQNVMVQELAHGLCSSLDEIGQALQNLATAVENNNNDDDHRHRRPAAAPARSRSREIERLLEPKDEQLGLSGEELTPDNLTPELRSDENDSEP